LPVRAGRNAGFLREIRKDVHRMRLFDVLGPVMIGPSSSHTAGAAKIGYTAQKLLGDLPDASTAHRRRLHGKDPACPAFYSARTTPVCRIALRWPNSRV